MAVGDRFVRRHNAARSSTSNTTAADISYDTAVISETGYSWSSPEVTVTDAGRYLCIFDIGQVDLASTRAVGTLVPSINSTDQTRFRATHRYLRNSGGAQEGASIGKCILDLSASDAVKVRNPGALTPTDAVGNYATNAGYGGGLQLIRLPDNDWTHVERTSDAAEVGTSNINTTRPWLDSSGTWTTVTYNSEINDDAGLYPGSGGDLTLAANTKYLIVFGATCYSTDASRHTYCLRLQIGGNNVQSLSGYPRNTASQGPPMNGMYLHETGGSTETLRMQATHETEGGDAGTPQVADAYMQVIELPSSAEWIHVDNGASDSLTTALAGLTTWYDTPLSSTFRADGDSNLSLDGTNNAVQNDSGGTLPVLAIGWHRWDRDSGASGTRKNPWTRWDNGGSAVGYGVAGAYSRGQQSGDDTFQAHYCSVATMDLANGADLSFQCNDEASGSNADMGVYASTSRYFLGVQVLNLDTLSTTSDTNVDANTETLTLTTYQAGITLDVNVSANTEALTLATQQATITLDVNVDASTAALSLATNQSTITYDRNVEASTAALTVATQQATVSLDRNISATTATLTLTALAASISLGVNVNTNVAALDLQTQPATISLDKDIQTSLETLSLTTYQASIDSPSGDVDIDATIVNLTLTEQPATVSLDVDIGASTESLTLTTYPATLSADTEISATTAGLTLTTYQASACLAPRVYLNTSQTLAGATELTVTDFATDGTSVTFNDPVGAPTGNCFLAVQNPNTGEVGWIAVTVTTGATVVNATTVNLTLTEQQASISLDVDVAANTSTLSLTEYPADIALDRDIAATLVALSLTTYPATVVYDVNIDAATAALTLTTYPAALDESVNVFANTASLTLTEYPATITYDVNVEASTETLTLTTYQASLEATTEIAANVVALSLTTYPATILADTTIAATTVGLTLDTYAATIELDVPVSGGGGGSWDPHRRSVVGVKLRDKPFRKKRVEREIEEVVEEVVEDVERLEAQNVVDPLNANVLAEMAKKRAVAREGLIKSLRDSERVSKRIAEKQLAARINELIRQRRDFLEIQALEDRLDQIEEANRVAAEALLVEEARQEAEDVEALLFILGEIV